MRRLVLTIAIAFIVLLGTLTAYVFIHNGVSADGVVAVLILILFAVGIVGALRHPPAE
jgi:VIT1/CCC1 family predicted Fe2+/Mn2+ transporter